MIVPNMPAIRRHALTHVIVGYSKGVPMGGDLPTAPTGKAPTFLVAALKDPIGANLDRLQFIKGWLDKDGKVQEQKPRIVHDMVSADDTREPGDVYRGKPAEVAAMATDHTGAPTYPLAVLEVQRA